MLVLHLQYSLCWYLARIKESADKYSIYIQINLNIMTVVSMSSTSRFYNAIFSVCTVAHIFTDDVLKLNVRVHFQIHAASCLAWLLS